MKCSSSPQKNSDSNRLRKKPAETLFTRGVPLIDLLHREFVVGDVRMRGIRLFEPCGHLVQVSKLPGIFKALNHRSGLKAAILTDGVIGVGDRITLHSTAATAAL
jgi:MOSC domain-containing protein YiiM